MQYNKILWCLIITGAFGQVNIDERLTYFPLQLGNVWQYYYTRDNDGDVSNGLRKYEVIGDTVLEDNYTYRVLRVSTILPNSETTGLEFLKIDSTNAAITSPDSIRIYDLGLVLNEFDTVYSQMGLCRIYYLGYGENEALSVTSDSMMKHEYSLLLGSGIGGIMQFYTWCYLFPDIGITFWADVREFPNPGGEDIFISESLAITAAVINGVQYGEFVTLETLVETHPTVISISQNYPNPFNSQTRIQFSISEREKIKISVSSITGEQISLLADREFNPGTHQINWDGSQVSSGIYLIYFESNQFTRTIKAVLMK